MVWLFVREISVTARRSADRNDCRKDEEQIHGRNLACDSRALVYLACKARSDDESE